MRLRDQGHEHADDEGNPIVRELLDHEMEKVS